MDDLINRVKIFLQNNNASTIIHINGHLFAELFNEVFNSPPRCAGCSTEVLQDIDKLTKFANGEHVIIKIKQMDFKLKEGEVVYDNITHAHYSERSSGWDEEKALNVLHSNPGERSRFELLPANVDELIEQHANELEGYKFPEAEPAKEKPVKKANK